MVLSIRSVEWPLAMAAFYGAPDDWLYRHSSKTYISVHHLRDADIRVINVKDIDSVVAMVLDTSYGITHQDGTEGDRWFLMEKPGLKMLSMIGMDDTDGMDGTDDIPSE
jgi:hypothetical protein